MSNVAIVTARGGSKRIPRKNIKNFMGNPMIAYVIKAALDSKIFDEVMVSTEDEEIASVAKSLGAVIPFMRSMETANDYAGTDDVLIEVLGEYDKRGKKFKNFCCLYPCSPFLTDKILKNAWNCFNTSGADSLVPVCEFESAPQRCLMENAKGFIEYREKEFINYRTQDLSPLYYDCGTFYFCKTTPFMENKKIISEKTVKYLMPSYLVQDIDTMEDWKMAEMKYKLINKL